MDLKEDYEQELVNRDEWHKLYISSLDPLQGQQMYTSYRTDVTFDMLQNSSEIQYMEKIKLRGTFGGTVTLQDNTPAYLVYIDGDEKQPMVVSYFDSADTSVVLDTMFPLQDEVKFNGFFYGTTEYIQDGEYCTALYCGFTEFDQN